MAQPPSSKITASMVAGALTVIIVAEAQRRGYPIFGSTASHATPRSRPFARIING